MEKGDFNLPTPQTLIKKAKEETVPVSLRVKESTLAIFDSMAKEAGVKVGSMMNTWLDFYAQNYASNSKDVSKDVMIRYINSEQFWKKPAEMSAEDLIYRLNVKGLVWPFMDNFENAAGVAYCYKSKDYEDIWICPEFHNDFAVDIHITEDGKPLFETDDENMFQIDVTAEQWPLVAVMVNEYGHKYNKVFPEKDICITPKMMQDIVEACKKYKNPDVHLAKAIKNIFLEFVESQDE